MIQIFWNTKSKLEKRTMLRGKATLLLWFEPSHDYVGPVVTEIIFGPVGLICTGFSPVGLFLGRKSKISHEQYVKEFQFYIRMTNFRLLGSIIIKKKYPKVVDPLKSIIISAYNQRVKIRTTLILEIFWKSFKNLHDSQEAHIYIYIYITKLKKEKIITSLFTSVVLIY